MAKLKNYFFDSAWCVAFRETATPLFLGDKTQKFHILPNSSRYWCADPFLFEDGNTVYIFMELYDILKQKGVIGYRTICNGKISHIHKCLETPYHLSYPYLFRKNGSIYMLPESYQSKSLTLYKAVAFPDKWEKCDVLLPNATVCDTDYIEQDGQAYLLTTPVYCEKFVYDRLEFYFRADDSWVPFHGNPVVSDASKARNAGHPFLHNGKLIRPSQNCEQQYGENLTFHVVDELSPKRYSEHEFAKIHVQDIALSNRRSGYSGIHTYNQLGSLEVIDLYRKETFQPLRFLYLLKNKLSRRR